MKNNEERVFNSEEEKIIDKLVNDWDDAPKNYWDYVDRVDLILEALKRNPTMIVFVPETLREKRSFYNQVKEILPEEALSAGYRYIEIPTIGNKIAAVGEKIADKYQDIDDFYMGRDLSNEDMWIGRTIALAFTPLPYVHLVTKGVVGIGKGIKTLGEYAYDKYQQIQYEKMFAKEEEEVSGRVK
jgi:hypothetical protein